MNVFPVHEDPAKCAEVLDDSRVIKIGNDVTRMLATAVSYLGAPVLVDARTSDESEKYYIRVATESLQHFAWLVAYGLGCMREHYKRTGHAHKNACILIFLFDYVRDHELIPDTPPKEALLCWGVEPCEDYAAKVLENLEFRWTTQRRDPKFYGKTDPRITALREA